MDLVAGQLLGRYEIVSHLGSGGMGVVYRARDTELGRDVAVKVLNDRAAAKPSRIEGFSREARAVARLSHPNILDIHDFGADDGVTYAVTELLEGKTLRDRLRWGPIPLNKGLEICECIAEGLAAAHGEGIVHRDIKPSNIFVTNTGQVKILDFGIAHLREQRDEQSDDGSQLPTESVAWARGMIGTVGYMAPEQIDGHAVDARSDIFSLGCVMYEVLTGKRAFVGETSTDVMLAILGKDPMPIREVCPEVPPPIEAIVKRCLEKQPGERFESARDVAFALRAVSVTNKTLWRTKPHRSTKVLRSVLEVVGISAVLGAAMVVGAKLTDIWPSPAPEIPGDPHVAIVPLQAVGGSEELARFAAGLSEILTEDLEWCAQWESGRSWVVPAQKVRTVGTVNVGTVYRRFNPNIVLTGAVDRDGPTLLLHFRAIEPASGRDCGSTELKVELGNVSSLQLNPLVQAAKIAGLNLRDEQRKVLEARMTSVARAFDLYAQARGILAGASKGGETPEAVALLEEVTRLDPLFDPARDSLARALIDQFSETGDDHFFDRGLEEIRNVIRRRPSAQAYRVLAALYVANGANEEAVAALKKAVELAPKSGAAFEELGAAYQSIGRVKDAEQAYERSINLRPGFWPGPDALGRLYLSQGRYDAAANSYRRVIDWAPRSTVGYNVLGVIQFLQDDLEASRTTFEQSIAADPTNNYFAFANLGTLHFNAARFADAITVYEQALKISDDDYMVWGNLAFAYAFGAEPEKAEEPFRRAIELAERRRETDRDDPNLLVELAGFYAMTGEPERSRDLVERAVALGPTDPQIFAKIGETFEDLKDREAALHWIGRALDAGIPPRIFDSRPMLRDLVADERYRVLVETTAPSPV